MKLLNWLETFIAKNKCLCAAIRIFWRIKKCSSISKRNAKSGSVRYHIMPTTKSSKPRTIEPPPIAFEYLRAERVKQLENRLRAGSVEQTMKDTAARMQNY